MLYQPSQLRNLALLVVLALLCAYTALASFFPLTLEDGEYYVILLTKAHYAAFLAIAACLLSYFVVPKFFRRALGITLLLAIFGLINFLPTAVSISTTLGAIQLGINPFALLLLAIFYFSNRPAVNAFIRKNLLPAPTPQQATAQRRAAINQFKQTFARKTDESLQQIVEQRQLVGDAVTAAQELLQERNSPLRATEL